MSTISVIGAGYVGLVTAACFAKLGHDVTCIETDTRKLRELQVNRLPIHEPGLHDLWREGLDGGRLHVTSTYHEAVARSAFVFIAVGTPPMKGGRPDLSQITSATRSVARSVRSSNPVIVVKSTVPVGTAELIERVMEEHTGRRPQVVSNPEFLREGSSVLDFLRPDRIIIGGKDSAACNATADLYHGLRRPIVRCSSRTAELIKYASNSFLCTKVSFINEIAMICDRAGVDVVDVSRALGLDPRMGFGYLDAGLGWGGGCLPKDIEALIWMAGDFSSPTPLLQAALRVNRNQPRLAVNRLETEMGLLRSRSVAVLGLTFKPNCDDIRESPALSLVQLLVDAGASVRAFDPMGMEDAAVLYPDVLYCEDALTATTGADAVVLATAWPDFLGLDFTALRAAMRGHLVLDARNAWDGAAVAAAGFKYISLGRMTQDGRKRSRSAVSVHTRRNRESAA